MARPRSQLHNILKNITPHVYFQPPNGLKMTYPCIVYRRDDEQVDHADNLSYRRTKRYQITVIDANPDSDIPGKVADLPLCVFNRFFTSDYLNHDIYNLYF